ncbi:MAG: glycosyltransferase family 39 protein [Bdellovibrio sp.]|nr:glycosyltransferase family 39 protein [Bdellovibrio sp.]
MRQLKELVRRNALLILFICVAYLPFLGFRLVRTAGDEKVYITQALEMAKNGTLFLQSLGGVPDYYKGPAHYVLIQLGLKIFGLNLWSVLYMNFAFVLMGAVAIAELIRNVFPQKKHWAFWAGAFFAFNVGVSGHLFTSQMEAELVGFYGLGFFLLWRSKNWQGDLAFWIVAGICGWFKSPLHSVLIGLSALLFWAWTGEVWRRLKDPRFLLAAVAGIVVGAIGYAPAFVMDQKNFLELYLKKETFKNSNGGPWWQAFVPMVSYYLIPFMSLAVVSYIETVALFFSKGGRQLNPEGKRVLKLALSGIFPTLGFFTYYFYRGENYALPVIGPFVLLFFCLLYRAEGVFKKLRASLLWSGTLFGLPLAGLLSAIYFRFEISGSWWPAWVIPLAWFLVLVMVAGVVWDHKKKENGLGYGVAVSGLSLILVLNLALFVFGEMEVYQLRERIHADRNAGETYRVSYWNLNRLIWNESGLMSVSVGEPITALYHEKDLLEAIRNGDLILGRDTDVGKEIAALAAKHFPDLEPVTYPWDRWKTHAADGSGNSLIPQAWKQRDLSLLFDHALILRFKPRPKG